MGGCVLVGAGHVRRAILQSMQYSYLCNNHLLRVGQLLGQQSQIHQPNIGHIRDTHQRTSPPSFRALMHRRHPCRPYRPSSCRLTTTKMRYWPRQRIRMQHQGNHIRHCYPCGCAAATAAAAATIPPSTAAAGNAATAATVATTSPHTTAAVQRAHSQDLPVA